MSNIAPRSLSCLSVGVGGVPAVMCVLECTLCTSCCCEANGAQNLYAVLTSNYMTAAMLCRLCSAGCAVPSDRISSNTSSAVLLCPPIPLLRRLCRTLWCGVSCSGWASPRRPTRWCPTTDTRYVCWGVRIVGQMLRSWQVHRPTAGVRQLQAPSKKVQSNSC